MKNSDDFVMIDDVGKSHKLKRENKSEASRYTLDRMARDICRYDVRLQLSDKIKNAPATDLEKSEDNCEPKYIKEVEKAFSVVLDAFKKKNE